MSDLRLASEFPAVTREAWLGLVDTVLKGGDFDRKLVHHTLDGIRVEPLYGKADRIGLLGRPNHGPWRVAQRVDHPEPNEAAALALADLEGGADALVIVGDGSPAARGLGLPLGTPEVMDRALTGVMLDLVHLRLDAGAVGTAAMDGLFALAETRGHPLAELDLDLGLDPVGTLASTGQMGRGWKEEGASLAQRLADAKARGFAGRLVLASGRVVHEAGGSEAQEVATALATGILYLRALEGGGHPLEEARDALAFLLVADADEFLTVAKFRALRLLWRRVEEACGMEPKPIRVHAETAWRMTTRRDPWVNILRAAIAAFSAGIGGADTITVLPFTAALGLPDAFARRVARNTQLILLEEANLWRVADPVAGAGGFEALTNALADEAWTRFQEIEREGGIVASLSSGTLGRRVAETRAKRDAAIATRRDPLIGTSEFPNMTEAPVATWVPAASHAPRAEAPGRAGRRSTPAGTSWNPPSDPALQVHQDEVGETPGNGAMNPLHSLRLAEPYERLRDRSDDILARTGARPRVFLANLGPIAAFSGRSTFARNAFEAGGIEAVGNDGYGSLDELAQAFAASRAKLACLCSSDAIYETQAVPAAVALRDAGAVRIYVAGRPGDLEAALRAAGVTEYVHVGMDLVRALEESYSVASW
jgi:methylmalonyl-CoA mutase